MLHTCVVYYEFCYTSALGSGRLSAAQQLCAEKTRVSLSIVRCVRLCCWIRVPTSQQHWRIRKPRVKIKITVSIRVMLSVRKAHSDTATSGLLFCNTVVWPFLQICPNLVTAPGLNSFNAVLPFSGVDPAGMLAAENQRRWGITRIMRSLCKTTRLAQFCVLNCQPLLGCEARARQRSNTHIYSTN